MHSPPLSACSLVACAGFLFSMAWSCSPSAATASAGATDDADAATAPLTDAGPSACETFHAALDEKVRSYASAKRAKHELVLGVATRPCGAHVFVANEETPGVPRGYPIGSITKTYVAAAVMQHVQAGRIALDNVVSTYVTGIPFGDRITVRQLLSHRSGLFNYNTASEFAQSTAYTPEQLLSLAAARPLDFEPGAKYAYSNTNYVGLGVLLEKLSGKPAHEALRSFPLAPAGLEHSWLEGAEPQRAPLASGWRSSGLAWPKESYSGAWTAGAMVATPEDALHWVEALVSAQVLSPAVSASMLPDLAKNDPYGLGVFGIGATNTGGLGNCFGHDGAIMAFRSQAFFCPDSGVGMLAITTQQGKDPNDLLLATLEDIAAFARP